MQPLRSLLLLTLILLPLACDDVEYLDDDAAYADETGGVDDDELRTLTITKPSRAYSMMTQWGPCNPNDAWGCNGSLGSGLACLRPVSDYNLNICAPQTWDPNVDDDCENVNEPNFGDGVRLQGSAYCVPDCDTDADCGVGRKCSPQSHFCAWIGN